MIACISYIYIFYFFCLRLVFGRSWDLFFGPHALLTNPLGPIPFASWAATIKAIRIWSQDLGGGGGRLEVWAQPLRALYNCWLLSTLYWIMHQWHFQYFSLKISPASGRMGPFPPTVMGNFLNSLLPYRPLSHIFPRKQNLELLRGASLRRKEIRNKKESSKCGFFQENKKVKLLASKLLISRSKHK